MNHKIIISTGILVLSALCILVLSKQAIILSIILIFIAFAKHTLYPIKKEFLWFLLICVGGAIVEMILVNFGHAWSYSTPNVFGIPIWMPLFWGVVGTTIIVMYDGLINK